MTLKDILEQRNESEMMDVLEELYLKSTTLSKSERIALNNFKTTNYALIGLIGLILNDKARILLGKKQNYYHQIQKLCLKVPVNYSDLEIIADWDISRDLNEAEEFVWRKVMLEYPAS